MAVYRDHNSDDVITVVKTAISDAWGDYGPGFPFQIDRYKDFIEKSLVRFVDPVLGPCHSFKFTLTKAGQELLGIRLIEATDVEDS